MKKPAGKKVPKYCLHTRSNNAFVKLNGKQIWLGRYGSEESRSKYLRIVAEWEANGRQLPARIDGPGLSIEEIAADYLLFCETYYRREDGTDTGETTNVSYSLDPLLELYATTPAKDFSIAKLKAVRQTIITEGLARSTINSRIARIVRMFRWASGEEKVPPQVYGDLKALQALPRGRSEAHETKPKSPVTWSAVEATLPKLGRRIQALVLVMWYTGMRCGEAVQLRGRHVDMTGQTWLFDPPHAKNRHHGKDCRIDIGPKAQAVLRPFLSLDPIRYWFRPIDELAEHTQMRRSKRKTKIWPSHLRAQAKNRVKNPKRQPSDLYDTRAVAHAIRRACKALGIPCWSPHQLRHAALTRIRKEHGIEAAIAIGGHSSVAMTEHYTRQAARDLARSIAVQLG